MQGNNNAKPAEKRLKRNALIDDEASEQHQSESELEDDDSHEEEE